MKTNLLLPFLILGLWTTLPYAQEINSAKLDSLFNVLETENQTMGSVAIAKGDQVVYQKAIGYRYIDEEEKSHAQIATKYRVGSISKMFTSVIMFQLVEEGKVSFDETLDTYFPEIDNADKITLEYLLNHRSGIHNFTHDAVYMSYYTQPKSMEEMVAIIAEAGSDFEPNAQAAYSNSNFVLLGFIIEQVTGHSYAVNLKKRIAEKLKLHHTYVGGKINPSLNEALSYQKLQQWQEYPETDMSIPGGAGAVVSTPTDLTRFIHGLFNGQLISSGSLEKMISIHDDFGMGIFRVPFFERTGYGHNGSIDVFQASVGYFPEDNLAIAYCTNGQVYPMNDIVIGALSIVFGREYRIPTFETVTLDTVLLEEYTGIYGSSDFPLKLTVTREGQHLFAQATGQLPIPLEAIAVDMFKFDAAGIRIEFIRPENEMILQQAGGKYTFKKE